MDFQLPQSCSEPTCGRYSLQILERLSSGTKKPCAVERLTVIFFLFDALHVVAMLKKKMPKVNSLVHKIASSEALHFPSVGITSGPQLTLPLANDSGHGPLLIRLFLKNLEPDLSCKNNRAWCK